MTTGAFSRLGGTDDGAGRRDGHYLLHWQARGHAWVLQGGRRARLEPGLAVLIDTRRPYKIHYLSARHHELVLAIPCDQLDAMIRGAEDLTVRVLDTDEPAGRLLALLMGLVQQERERRPGREELSLAEALTSVIAAALRELPGEGVARERSPLEAYSIACLRHYVNSLLPQLDRVGMPGARVARRVMRDAALRH